MPSFQRRYVASGSYFISERKRLILDALLGSCAGVAVVDREAGVGGLYHILLPVHPVAGEHPVHSGEALYAESGMPLFLKALEDAGGSRARMEAVIAGGALIGRLSPLDLRLDIGGRTVEVARSILDDAGIRVIFSETGGFFGSRLQLDLQTLQYSVDPAYPDHGASLADEPGVAGLTGEELDRAVARIKPIPQVALKIIRTFQSDDYEMREITEQVLRDQVISAKVLNLCNSAYVGAQKEIKSVNQALVVLGSKLVVRLILSSALQGFYECPNRGYSMSKGGMYHHAVSAAVVSEYIARKTGKSEPDVAYTAGLLHDIGKVLLDQYVSPAAPLFYRRVYANREELLNAEQSLLGVDHSEAGVRLAELWSFPEALKDVIAFHSRPENARSDPDLTHVVYLGNLLLSRFDVCRELENVGTEKLGGCLDRLGLNPDTFVELIGGISWNSIQNPV